MLEPGSPWRRLASPSYGVKVGAAAVIGSLALGGVAAAASGVSPTAPLRQVADFLGVSTTSATHPASDEPSESPSSSQTPTGTTSPQTTQTTNATESSDASESPEAKPSQSSDGSGPNALGPAAWGLCHAFATKTWGHDDTQSATTGTTGTTGATAPAGEPAQDGRKSGNPSVALQNLTAAAQSVGETLDGFCAVVLASHEVPNPWPTAATGSSTTGSTTTTPTQGSTATTAPSQPEQEHGRSAQAPGHLRSDQRAHGFGHH